MSCESKSNCESKSEETEFVNGAVEEEVDKDEEVAGWDWEKGVFKMFNDIIYNQLEVNPYSCTVVATYTALSNLTGKSVPYSLMLATLERMRKDGKFTENVGAYLKDGVEYALADFNTYCGSNWKANRIVLSPASIINGLKKSPIVTWIKYGKGFVADTQDNAWLDWASTDIIGSSGHAICIVKANTIEDFLVKMCNTYAGRLVKNVFGFDFNKYRSLMFNTGYYFTK